MKEQRIALAIKWMAQLQALLSALNIMVETPLPCRADDGDKPDVMFEQVNQVLHSMKLETETQIVTIERWFADNRG